MWLVVIISKRIKKVFQYAAETFCYVILILKLVAWNIATKHKMVTILNSLSLREFAGPQFTILTLKKDWFRTSWVHVERRGDGKYLFVVALVKSKLRMPISERGVYSCVRPHTGASGHSRHAPILQVTVQGQHASEVDRITQSLCVKSYLLHTAHQKRKRIFLLVVRFPVKMYLNHF